MEFSRLLLKLPEHTWGLHNLVEGYLNYTNAYFDLRYNLDPDYKNNEASWNEQRFFFFIFIFKKQKMK